MTIFGYARVSTASQDLHIQIGQLEAAGCERILFEKESGAKDHRREFCRLLRRLRRGDVVIVPALDRLTRGGPFKMLSILSDITARGATYKSLAEPWADTTHELGEVLAALVGYIARKTREDIIRRTSAGRERAKQAGVRFGRKPKLSHEQRLCAIVRRLAGDTLRQIAEHYQVSPSTISRSIAKICPNARRCPAQQAYLAAPDPPSLPHHTDLCASDGLVKLMEKSRAPHTNGPPAIDSTTTM